MSGGILQPQPEPTQRTGGERVQRVFLFTDMVGSLPYKLRFGETAAVHAVSAHDRLFRDCLKQFQGVEHGDRGDGFVVTFECPVQAVLFALTFQRRLAQLDLPAPVLVRIGIHIGRSTLLSDEGPVGEKYVGLAIDTASRVMALAEGRQILLTREIFDAARRESVPAPESGGPLQWRAHGEYSFKGLQDPIEIFEVGIERFSPLCPPGSRPEVQRAVTFGDEETLGWRPAVGGAIPSRPDWALDRRLGEGGFGEVWLAHQIDSNDQRSFKFCFHADRLRSLKREHTMFRLMQEALGNRPDIARLISVHLDQAPFYLEVEYTPSGDLVQWAGKRFGIGIIALPIRLELVAQIATALGAAHSVGILHKDVKPTNILIDEKAGALQARLTDFGIGQLIDRGALVQVGITATGFTMTMGPEPLTTSGSRLYMAPELIAGEPASIQSDIYSLGILLYQMVVGKFSHPLGQGWERDVEDELLRDDISACVDGDPSRRLTSAVDLARRLRGLESRRQHRESEIKARREAERGRRLRRALFFAVPVTLLLLGTISFVAIRDYLRAVEQTELRKTAETARAQAEAAREKAEYDQYITSVQYASSCIKEGLISLADSVLLGTRPRFRDWEWGYLIRRVHGEALTLAGHTMALGDARFNFDGSRVVTCSADSTAKLWDPWTGRELVTFRGHSEPINQLDISRDGQKILTSSLDGTMRIWNLDGKTVSTLTGHTRDIERAVLSPDGRLVASGSMDRTARIWNAETGEVLQVLQGHTKPIFDLQFSPDGSVLATASEDGFAILWNVSEGRSIHILHNHALSINTVRFNAEGTRVVTAGKDKTARVWDTVTGNEIFSLATHTDEVRSAVFSPDDSKILTASNDKTARIFDAHYGQELGVFGGHGEQVKEAGFNPSGNLILTTTKDWISRVWEVRNPAAPLMTLHGHAGSIVTATFDPNGAFVLTASRDGTAKLWAIRPDDGRSIQYAADVDIFPVTFPPDSSFMAIHDRRTGPGFCENMDRLIPSMIEFGKIKDVCFSPDGVHFVTASSDKTAKIWERGKTKWVHVLAGHRSDLVSARYSGDGRRIATTSKDGTAKIWDARDGRLIQTLQGREGYANMADLSLDGERVVYASGAGLAKVFEVSTGKELLSLDGHSKDVYCASFNPDGRWVATGSEDAVAIVWDAATGAQIYRLASHTRQVRSLAFNPGGTRLATGSLDGTIKIWDMSTGRLALTLNGHAGYVFNVEFSPDGRNLGSGGSDHQARLWNAVDWTRLADFTNPSEDFQRVMWRLQSDAFPFVVAGRQCAPVDLAKQN